MTNHELNRRTVLKTALGASVAGTGLSTLSVPTRGRVIREFAIEQGDACYPVVPLRNDEPVEEFYDYFDAEAHTSTDIEQSNVSHVFLYEGPDGLSLVVIHDRRDDGTGGAVSFDIIGLPTSDGEWVVRDDGEVGPTDTSPDWSWAGRHTDGGGFRGGLDGEFSITIDPKFNEAAERSPLSPGEIEEWQALSGNAKNPDRIPLDMSRPITIRTGECGTDDIDVQNVDPELYPEVCTTVQVDTEAGRAGDLTAGDFSLTENGEPCEITDVDFLGGGGSEPIDIAFVFDDTGSMGGEIDDMKANVRDFADNIESSGFDARYSLVSFKDDVEVDQGFTGDVDTFKSAVDALSASGGADIPEDNYDAIDTALDLSYRADAEKVVVDITDAPAHYEGDGSGVTNFTLEEIADHIRAEGATFVAVAPSADEVGDENSSKEVLADRAGGTFVDIRSADDFGVILDEIESILTVGRYRVCCRTALPCEDELRTVTVSVDDPSGDLVATGLYRPPDDCGIDIQVIDPGDYPDICSTVRVDTAAGRAGDLTASDFSVTEEGEPCEIADFESLTDTGGKLDIAVCFDDTGSMGDEISAMKASVRDFTDDIEAAGFDARYSLISFKDDVELDQNFTSSASSFKSAVDSLSASGGADIPEDNLDAIDTALGLSYRSDAEKVILDITDAPTHVDGDGSGVTNLTVSDVASRLRSEGVNFFAVSPPDTEVATETYPGKESLADEAEGTFINLRKTDDFGGIIEEIRTELTVGRYRICCCTELPCEVEEREVVITVEDPERGTLAAVGEYPPPEDCDDVADIQTIDPGPYPEVWTTVRVDTEAGFAGELGRDDFSIIEDCEPCEITDFERLGDGGKLDIAFCFDDTGSMGDEISAMKANVRDLADDIEARGYNARYSLVTFKDEVELDLGYTSDVDEFQAAVDALAAEGGGDTPELNFDALETALDLDERPDAQEVLVDITDSFSHYEGDGDELTTWTLSEMTARINEEDLLYIAVSPDEVRDSRGDKRTLANNVDGLWIDIEAEDFSAILDRIGSIVSEGRYRVCCESTRPCDDTERTIVVRIDDPGREERLLASGVYTPPEDCGDPPGNVQVIDPSDYPTVYSTVRVDTPAGRAGELGEENFTVIENDEERTIEDVDVLGGEGSGDKVDIAVCFDDTGSMGDEIAEMKDAVTDLADTVSSAGFDARWGLVTFKDDVEVDQSFTSSVSTFKSAVDALSATGGGDIPEDDLDAIDAALGLSYRADAEAIILDITDAPTHVDGDGSGVTNFTIPEIATRLKSEGVTFFAVAPPMSEVGDESTSKESLADQANGTFINIRKTEDFSLILEEIGTEITEARYRICYESPLPCDDTSRSVTIIIEDPDRGEITTSGEYTPPESCRGAAEVSADRSFASSTVPPGGTIEVTLTIEFSGDPGNVSIIDGWGGPTAGGSVGSITVAGSSVSPSASAITGSEVTLAIDGDDVGAGETIEANYTVDVLEPVPDDATVEFVGDPVNPDVASGSLNAEFGSDTIEVAAGPVERADTNNDGEISDVELQNAVIAWARGEFTDAELQTIIIAWAAAG